MRKSAHNVIFDSPDRALRAVTRLRAEGFQVAEVYSPFPIHGLDEALGRRETHLPWATFAGGLLGMATGIFLTLWTHVVSWPLNIGGKTNSAVPAAIPIIFELTVLFAAFATVFALFARSRLYPRRKGDQAPGLPSPRVTDDHFVVQVLEADASFAPERFAELCTELGPIAIQPRRMGA